MKVYTISIPPCPDPYWMPQEAEAFMKFVSEQTGLIGVHPFYDGHHAATFLLFDTVENARMAAARHDEIGITVGTYIMNADLSDDQQMLTFQGPEEMWKSGGKVQ